MDRYCLQEWELSIETLSIAFINNKQQILAKVTMIHSVCFGFAFLSFLEGGDGI